MFSTALHSLMVGTILAYSPAVLSAQDEPTPPRSDQRRVSLTVATRALARGDVLDTVIIWRWNGFAPDTVPALPGWVARRPIAAGEALRAPAVSPPPLIKSGTSVTAIWQDGPLRLVLSGVATNTAIAGAPVGVRINRSRRLDGVAVAPHTVRLR
jgi:flagella basal body P-ring formation protein FlgA